MKLETIMTKAKLIQNLKTTKKAWWSMCGAVVFALQGCGGGDGFGGDYNSSFSGTVTVGSTQYECKSQKAFDACSNTTQRDCSACTSNTTDTTPITAICMQPSTNTFNVTQSGCVLKLKTGDSTGVCNGTTLKLLDGTGLTKTKLLESGLTTNASITLNGQTVRCAI